jgi:hypothetical protein
MKFWQIWSINEARDPLVSWASLTATRLERSIQYGRGEDLFEVAGSVMVVNEVVRTFSGVGRSSVEQSD